MSKAQTVGPCRWVSDLCWAIRTSESRVRCLRRHFGCQEDFKDDFEEEDVEDDAKDKCQGFGVPWPRISAKATTSWLPRWTAAWTLCDRC